MEIKCLFIETLLLFLYDSQDIDDYKTSSNESVSRYKNLIISNPDLKKKKTMKRESKKTLTYTHTTDKLLDLLHFMFFCFDRNEMGLRP